MNTNSINQNFFLTGHSMGGFGTWSTAHEYPYKFNAIAPVSGGVSEINQSSRTDKNSPNMVLSK